MKRYGNTWSDLRFPTLFFAALALLVSSMVVLVRSDELTERLLVGGFIALLVFGLPMLAIAPTMLFEIVIDDTHITHRALGRYVLSRKRIEDLRSAEFAAGGWGAKLKFRDGTAIRFLGAHLGILYELKDHLERVSPPSTSFD